MTERFVYFDIESTGPDPYADRIVEICLVDSQFGKLETRVNPMCPIPEGASAVHGIFDHHVSNLPGFDAHAADVQAFIDGAVLVGYNLRRFDSVLLHRELRLARQRGLVTDDYDRIVQPEIDLFGMWQRLEPRTLTMAAKRFAGAELEDAHAASADTLVLPDILTGMLLTFKLGQVSVEQLVELSMPEGAVDRDGKFRRRADGVVVFTIGATTRDQPVLENPGMLRWMLDRDFTPETKYWARTFLSEAMACAPSY